MAVPPIVALEIGTTKVVALVGELREDGNVMITGMGQRPSAGVRKGRIVDLESAAVCVRSVLNMAEESGKVAIRRIHLAASGGHVQSMVNRGAVPVLDPDSEISQRDVDQVMEVARAVNLPPDREILHTICQHFVIDGQERVLQPEGMEGVKLGLDMLVIHGIRNLLNNAVRVVRSIPLDVQDVAFGGLCAALSVLTAEQKKSGVIVIDMGGGSTDYLAYAGNVVAAAGSLAVGGDHITNDISLAFNVPSSRAERIKCENGAAMIGVKSPTKRVKLPPEEGFAGRVIEMQSLHTVIHARVDETLTMVKSRVEEAGVLHQMGAGVVLTGGCAYLRGITELAERIFGVPAVIGTPRNVSGLATATEGAEFATCSGLAQYGFRTSGAVPRPSLSFPEILKGWLRR